MPGHIVSAVARATPVLARAGQAHHPGSRLRWLVPPRPAMLAPASVAHPSADSFTTPPRHWHGSTVGAPWIPWAPLLKGARRWESLVPAAGCGAGFVAAPLCSPSRGRGGSGTGFFTTTMAAPGVFPERPPCPPHLGIASIPPSAVQVWALRMYVGCCFPQAATHSCCVQKSLAAHGVPQDRCVYDSLPVVPMLGLELPVTATLSREPLVSAARSLTTYYASCCLVSVV